MEALPVKGVEMPVGGATQAHCFFEHRVEHRREIAGRRVDDLQDLGGRGFSGQRRVTLGLALGKLTSQIGYDLLGIA
jgi:hypothetical protein